jgi:hypothetical protein
MVFLLFLVQRLLFHGAMSINQFLFFGKKIIKAHQNVLEFDLKKSLPSLFNLSLCLKV